mgnify:CR=1 FL=1
MADIKRQTKNLMSAIRRKGLPSSEKIVEEAFKKLNILPDRVTPELLQKNFSQILNRVWIETLNVLEKYESRIYPLNVIDELIALKNDVIIKAEKITKAEGLRPAVRFFSYPFILIFEKYS